MFRCQQFRNRAFRAIQRALIFFQIIVSGKNDYFFTFSGYGNISPKTIAGQMFCIMYALIGIPLLLVFMAKIGDAMAVGVRWVYRFEIMS